MKKQLLIGAMLMGAFLTTNAQTATTTISFEEAEGYTAGELITDMETGAGQNGWVTNSTNFVITDDVASEGTFSLQAMSTDSQPENLFFAVKPVELLEGTYEISQDIYTDLVDGDLGSNLIVDTWYLNPEDETYYIVTRILFDYSGAIGVADGIVDNAINYSLAGEFEAETWYNVKTAINEEAGTMTLFIDNVEIATVELLSPEVHAVSFQFDDWASSYSIDNVVVADGTTAGTNDVLASKFTVYPNPANNVINIANAENILVNGVVITDLNGRTVKNVSYDGVAEAQINVSDLAAGMYMMTVSSDKGTMTKKIVKN